MQMFTIEYYTSDMGEESDPDPMYVIESDNTDDLFTKLESQIGGALRFTYADTIDGDLRYFVHDISDDDDIPDEAIGVAIVVYPAKGNMK